MRRRFSTTAFGACRPAYNGCAATRGGEGMARVLVIEKDELIAAMERDFLEDGGFEVTVTKDENGAASAVARGNIDAILIEHDFPAEKGLALIQQVREKTNIPILAVSSLQDDEAVLQALAAGIDDYIVKPFNPTLLVARLKAHLAIHDRLLGKRLEIADGHAPDIECGDLRIYVRRRQVYRGEQEILLTGKEFNLLVFLARHPNQVFSKKYLFETIWHLDAYGEMATVTVHVNRLRDKLNEVEPEFTAIETVWGNGYRFRLSP